jgi:hypothetical protein
MLNICHFFVLIQKSNQKNEDKNNAPRLNNPRSPPIFVRQRTFLFLPDENV